MKLVTAMNQQNKWQQDLDKLTDTAFKKTDSELFNLYRNKLIEIKKVVKHYTDIYPDLSFSKKLEIERQLQVGNEIQNILASVDKDVHQSVKDFAVNQGNLGYNGVFYAMEGAENITTPMTVINQKYIVNALNKPVAGKRLSKRLYQNRDHLSKVSTQALIDGLWDGNGYAEVAKRITDQTEASYRQSLRIARTEGGRVRSVTTQQGYDDAADMGIQFEKEWLATSDSRTRHDHTVLDGQRVEPDDEFEIAGNHAVGPRLFGIAREDINCRCTTISVVKDVPNEFKNAEGASISHDNYDNWLKSKQDLKKPELSDQELVEKYLNEGRTLTWLRNQNKIFTKH